VPPPFATRATLTSPLFPTDILARADLTSTEKVVAVAILWHVRPADDVLTCWPTNRRLATMTGMSTRNIGRALRGLEDKAVLSRTGEVRRILTISVNAFGQDRPGVDKAVQGGRTTSSTHRRRVGKKEEESSTRTTWLTPLFDALSRVCLDAPDDEREAKAWFGWWAREVSRLIKHLAKVNAKQDRPPPDQDAVVLYMAWVAEDVLGGAWPDTFPTAPLKSIRYLCATARGEDTIDRYRSKLRREYRERLDDELAGA